MKKTRQSAEALPARYPVSSRSSRPAQFIGSSPFSSVRRAIPINTCCNRISMIANEDQPASLPSPARITTAARMHDHFPANLKLPSLHFLADRPPAAPFFPLKTTCFSIKTVVTHVAPIITVRHATPAAAKYGPEKIRFSDRVSTMVGGSAF